MKAKRTVRSVALVAAGLLATTTAVSFASVSANAASRTSVIINETTAMTSLNPGTPDTNLVTNTDIAYLTSIGFFYYNNGPTLIRNTKFGTYDILKNKTGDFQVKYTVKKGQVWSDGVPITGVDLLLSHILGSSAYSKKAGLGDPSGSGALAFTSINYAAPYDSHIKSVELSKDQMSVTLKYDSFQPDWKIFGPGPSPVHALELMVDGKKALPTVAEGKAATAQFLKDFNQGLKGSAPRLKKMGKIWSTAYNIKNINSGTNPLLLVSNGGFIIKSASGNNWVKLVRNPKYTSGPALSNVKGGIQQVTFAFVTDGQPAAQALANGEIDVYDGQPDTATYKSLKAMSGVKVEVSPGAVYEHVDLRSGKSSLDSSNDSYNGPFAGDGQKATDLRRAFLLALPRQSIVNKEVLQVFDPEDSRDAVVMNSNFLFPGSAAYDQIVNASGVKDFTSSNGSQADRTAQALALVKKYYPNASAQNQVVDINMLFKNNSRRIAENAIIAAEEAKAGFNVSTTGNANWSTLLDDPSYDVAMFAWSQSAVSQTGVNAQYQSDGGNNHYGWNDPALDTILHALETQLTDAQVTAKQAAADKIIMDHAWTLPLYQWPAVAAYTSALKNIKPNPLSPNIVWNYWEWHF
jgi:peptide/nickel transport system substrate-binding protein